MTRATDDRPARFVKALARLERGHLAQLRRGVGGDSENYWLERLFTLTGYGDAHPYTKEALELLAGLYALKPQARDEIDGDGAEAVTELPDDSKVRKPPSIGALMAAVHLEQNRRNTRLPGDPSSTEKRFLGLLDADWEGLPHHLRQTVTLLEAQEYTPDWEKLALDLLAWSRGIHSSDRVRREWAQDFYREIGKAQAALQKTAGKADSGDPMPSAAAPTIPTSDSDHDQGETL